MTVFDYINDILFHKKGISSSCEDNPFNGYLANRWISMYSPEMATVVNNSTNWLYSIFETKEPTVFYAAGYNKGWSGYFDTP